MITILWPGLRLVNSSNTRECKMARSTRASKHRQGALHRVANAIPSAVQRGELMLAPYRVTITRLAPRKLDADDNLNISAKSIRDGVADALGVDDGDTLRVKWDYAQEKSKEYGVRIEIRSGA